MSADNIKHLEDTIKFIAEDIGLDARSVKKVVRLLQKDNTVPFIARYRRDETGNLEAKAIRTIQESLERAKAVESRKDTVSKSIGDKLTPEIKHTLKEARTWQDVEDIYAPFKPGSKGTLANRARNLGLDQAAELIHKNPTITNFSAFVQPEKKGLLGNDEVVKGVKHILADQISKDNNFCNLLKSMFESSRIIVETKVQKKFEEEKKYKDYHQMRLSVNKIKAHQILAINRAEGDKILQVKVTCPPRVENRFIQETEKQYISKRSSVFVRETKRGSLADSYNRLMLPKLIRHKRNELTKNAEREAVQVFSRNLRRLLITPPVTGRVVLGIDPGFKHGCKIAVVSENGVILETAILNLFDGREAKMSEQRIQGLLLRHNCYTIALGNGKACRETEQFLTRMKKSGKLKKDVVYSIVSEDGASIYSVSEEAQNEMPNLDVNLRSAVSIARRLQNPLLELIKIEPKHIGVGMYQHDIPEQLLKQELDGVLEDCVSLVGVDLNASGVHALKRIAGLNERKAKEIIAWRDTNGAFTSREQLKKVRGIGPKSFEQCAGFVRIFQRPPEVIVLDTDDDESDKQPLVGKRKAEGSPQQNKRKKLAPAVTFNKLDSTSIHPESYTTATKLVSLTKASLADIGQPRMKKEIDNLVKTQGFSTVCKTLECNPETLRFIINGLCQTIGYDVRADFSKPLFRQGVISMKDLTMNSQITGRVTNVTTFGAFVDLGVEHNGLIHTSQMPVSVRDSLGAGDIVDVVVLNLNERKNKIGLKLTNIRDSSVDMLR